MEDSPTIVPVPDAKIPDNKASIPTEGELCAMVCGGVSIGTFGANSIVYGDNINFKLVG